MLKLFDVAVENRVAFYDIVRNAVLIEHSSANQPFIGAVLSNVVTHFEGASVRDSQTQTHWHCSVLYCSTLCVRY
jgi:hypothetical protein